MKNKLKSILFLVLIITLLTSCSTNNNILINKSNINDNKILFEYNNLPKEYRDYTIKIEKYSNGILDGIPFETLTTPKNVSVARNGNIQLSYTILPNNNIEIEAGGIVISKFIGFNKFKDIKHKMIVNNNKITFNYNEYILGAVVINREEIDIKENNTNFEDYINDIIDRNDIVYVLKGNFHK